MKQKVVIVGSTGSIGTQTLDVIRKNLKDFEVAGLTAHKNIRLLEKQVKEFNPTLGGTLGATINREEIEKMVIQSEVDTVVFAYRGTNLLSALLNAIKAGKKIVIANKEMIVEEGEKIMKEVQRNNVQLIPVDSEHCGIFQCLQGRKKEDVEKVILTCSGGPFLNTSREKLKSATAKEALKHPTWKMGQKITIDSATLMNKALEIIEAKYLFDLELVQIEVLVHPQSFIHALVQFKDGNVLAHFGYPDMRIPISYALYYPKVKHNTLPRLDLQNTKLEFYKPDINKFPSIQFAYDALSRKGNLPKRLNRSNELAVEKFIKGEITFREIFDYIKERTFKI